MRALTEADFVITIDFDRGQPDPGRVFRAATHLISAFELLDAELAASIDTGIQTQLILTDIEVGSIRIWLSNALKAVDDQALKDLDWKPQVGKYLVAAKYAVIRLLDEHPTLDLNAFESISARLHGMAQATAVKFIPDYKPPSLRSLISVTAGLSRASGELAPTDKIAVQSTEGQLPLKVQPGFQPDSVEALLVADRVSWPAAPMVLKIKKPDYLGTSMWEFRHGRTPVSAKIEDLEWLLRFRQRTPDAILGPGDALRCEVEREVAYDARGDMLKDTYRITKVHAVVHGAPEQLDAFGEG